MKKKTHIINTSKPFIPNEWKLEYNNDQGEITLDPSNLLLHLEPEQEEGCIKGEVLAERMKDTGLGSAVLKYLLDNPSLIPKEWKDKWVYFWGTILLSPNGYRCVLCLYFGGGRWDWHCDWLGDGFSSRDPSAVLASTQTSKPSSLDPVSLALEHLEKAEEEMEKARKLLESKQ